VYFSVRELELEMISYVSLIDNNQHAHVGPLFAEQTVGLQVARTRFSVIKVQIRRQFAHA
jgi:hypothetical protein